MNGKKRKRDLNDEEEENGNEKKKRKIDVQSGGSKTEKENQSPIDPKLLKQLQEGMKNSETKQKILEEVKKSPDGTASKLTQRMFPNLSQNEIHSFFEKLDGKTYPKPPGMDDSGFVNLNDMIDINCVSCLNEKVQDSAQKCFDIFRNRITYLESDDDPDLLLSIPFKSPVNITSIKFECTAKKNFPKNVKFFVNNPNMDFDDIEISVPTQVITMTGDEKNGGCIARLNTRRFKQIKHLSIYVVDNCGNCEKTRVGKIRVEGEIKSGLNMKNFAPVKME